MNEQFRIKITISTQNINRMTVGNGKETNKRIEETRKKNYNKGKQYNLKNNFAQLRVLIESVTFSATHKHVHTNHKCKAF